jgi:hypothetical protein
VDQEDRHHRRRPTIRFPVQRLPTKRAISEKSRVVLFSCNAKLRGNRRLIPGPKGRDSVAPSVTDCVRLISPCSAVC